MIGSILYRSHSGEPVETKCPHCEKPSSWKDNPFRPFCSERCKKIDLGDWADEKFKVPHTESPDPEDV